MTSEGLEDPIGSQSAANLSLLLRISTSFIKLQCVFADR